MKITLENVGLLKSAEFNVNDLTIICGENNTGKTYAAYSLYGFLREWRTLLRDTVNIISKEEFDSLYKTGALIFDLSKSKDRIYKLLKNLQQEYIDELPSILASKQNFDNSKFRLELFDEEFDKSFKEAEKYFSIGTGLFELEINKNKDDMEIKFSLLFKKEEEDEEEDDISADINIFLEDDFIKETLEEATAEYILDILLPDTFITTAERTGVSVFNDELNVRRAELRDSYETLVKYQKIYKPTESELNDSNISAPISMSISRLNRALRLTGSSYSRAIQDNMDFINRLQTIATRQSFIAKEHSQLLQELEEIIGGKYTLNDAGLLFAPENDDTRLTMIESSSGVRSMVHLNFYLKHTARKGDLLIIDEPELNLHPANQRKMARLLAKLVHNDIGIKVLISTHSDHIIRELNTLIVLDKDNAYHKKIMKKYDYSDNELLEHRKISVYTAENGKLTPNEVSKEDGIEVPSFDEAIMAINAVQGALTWEDDE